LVTRADHAHFVAVRCIKWVWSARETKNLGGHVTLTMPPFRKISKGHVRTVPGNMPVKFEVRSFNPFGAISTKHLTPKNLRGHVTLATPLFRKILKGSGPDCPWKHARQI